MQIVVLILILTVDDTIYITLSQFGEMLGYKGSEEDFLEIFHVDSTIASIK